ncbi:MAG: phosphoribosylamine--glycine ligase, partial [Thermodesulfobacteriota bacterium]|nr:phosphoribosylamine--glycine ligase [Thermodesulfobacteriota bacterium]
DEIKKLASFARSKDIDLTLVGPELPLTLGIVDEFKRYGLKICGPDKNAAIIEGSKLFAKDLMKKQNVPTAAYATFDNPQEAISYLKERGTPAVIKADGLAAGKGVIPVQTLEEAEEAIDAILTKKTFGDAGSKIVIEDFLTGEEASFIVFTDGNTILPLPSSQDHKAIYDNDKGPNTGGMGAYSPAPVITGRLQQKVMDEVMTPIVKGMADAGRPFKGTLYAGLMIDGEEIKVLEFNARLGDPEAQPILMRMKTDLIPVLEAIVDERLDQVSIEWDERPAVCVVMASQGYPGSYQKGMEITGLNDVESLNNVEVFHAGTALKDGQVVTSGGRVLGVTALGSDIEEAIGNSYNAVSRIKWEGVYFRKDIGQKALNRNR